MKVRYIGSEVERTIAETGETVQQNHQIEVTDALGKSLLEQKGVWEKVATPKPTTKKKETS